MSALQKLLLSIGDLAEYGPLCDLVRGILDENALIEDGERENALDLVASYIEVHGETLEEDLEGCSVPDLCGELSACYTQKAGHKVKKIRQKLAEAEERYKQARRRAHVALSKLRRRGTKRPRLAED